MSVHTSTHTRDMHITLENDCTHIDARARYAYYIRKRSNGNRNMVRQSWNNININRTTNDVTHSLDRKILISRSAFLITKFKITEFRAETLFKKKSYYFLHIFWKLFRFMSLIKACFNSCH